MNTKDNDKANKFISKLCSNGEKVIESECFEGVNYLVKDNHIVILAGRNGELSVEMDKVCDLAKEINEIRSVWGNINTDKCLVGKDRKEDGK